MEIISFLRSGSYITGNASYGEAAEMLKEEYGYGERDEAKRENKTNKNKKDRVVIRVVLLGSWGKRAKERKKNRAV